MIFRDILRTDCKSAPSGIFDYETNTITHDHNKTWFEINANQFGQAFFTPTYRLGESPSQYPRDYNEIDWNWFLLFNPLILL